LALVALSEKKSCEEIAAILAKTAFKNVLKKREDKAQEKYSIQL
jgi:hypothetical protein